MLFLRTVYVNCVVYVKKKTHTQKTQKGKKAKKKKRK